MPSPHRVSAVLALGTISCVSVAGPSTEEDVFRWCSDFATKSSFRCSYRFDGYPTIAESESPKLITQTATISIRWPDAMLLNSVTLPADTFDRKQDARLGSFIRIFKPDSTVSASTYGGPIVVSNRAVVFAEEAWRYCHVSPWIIGQMILSENPDFLVFQQEDTRSRVDVGKSGVSAFFDSDGTSGSVRLVEVRVVESKSNLDTTYSYSDFVSGGPNGRHYPRKFAVTGRFKIVDRISGSVRESTIQTLGAGTILTSQWPDTIPETEFEFPQDIIEKTKNKYHSRQALSANEGKSKRDPVPNSEESSASTQTRDFKTTANGVSRSSWVQVSLYSIGILVFVILTIRVFLKRF